ncbi:GntR family transcriptional regulator [Sphingomonas canadensis]|uniref:GntR family transcriptional regulator n=1 Tax=Sphingomonas canadensis TaxID=1219257 RepID=A0ABW3HAD5_9SPHN|nr:GntR family transcriptional regulator [Sphingomonas canadensis]MCW3838093.1 GntR family transcriptional regulator [Sphingomonas canadensis]
MATPAPRARFAPVQRNTLKDQSYAQLRQALITGRFEPGENVTVKLLAEQLGSGIMPVREAVQRLVAEGALVNLPSGRVYVPALTRAEFDEVIEIRLLLEPYCCRKATANMNPRLVAELRALQEQLQRAASGDQAEAMLWANYQFHFGIYRQSGMGQMLPLIEAVWLRFGPMMKHSQADSADARAYVEAELHAQDELCGALERHDGEGAARMMEQIVNGTADWYRRTFPFAED